MEKGTPACKLKIIKSLVEAKKVRATFSALCGAAVMGLNFHDMLAIVMSLTPTDFYKSMTTHGDHRARRLPTACANRQNLFETLRHG